MKLTTIIITIIVDVCLWLNGWLVHQYLAERNEPNCPTEDSCEARYSDGGWEIVEVTP